MNSAEQLMIDMKADEELRRKFHKDMNTLRGNEKLSVIEAMIRVARELGYEVSEDEAKALIARLQKKRGGNKTQLNDYELDDVAGGNGCRCVGGYICGNWPCS